MVVKGQKISDRYEIIRSIGEGGMANVYLAHDDILNRDVAIKVLRGDLSSDEKFVRRFQREALAASSLSHPNIVEMYDVGEDNGNYYIVMEYVEGKTLKQLLKKRSSLTLSEAIDIMLQLTDGISHAHDSYIIHRDLKPQNIMITDDGGIKITDFGIAMALNGTQLTQTNSVMGSVHYLPPEQASGKGSTIKSDVYSMGIVFYELLTGILPFKGENAVEIALKQMREPLPSVKEQNPLIPQSVENVIIKATAKNPKNRYRDAKEMHNDLLTALDDSRKNEPRYIYPYPENEQEEKAEKEEEDEGKTKEVIALEKTSDIVTPIVDKESKRTSIWMWILIGVVTLVVGTIFAIFVIIPPLTEIPDVKIPDVTNMSVIDAEEKLKKAGFIVKVEIEKVPSDKIEKGKVVKTSPDIGRSIKKGSEITLYESLGMQSIEIDDYTGKNYIQIKTILETVNGLKVTIEKKDVDLSERDYDDQELVDQSVKPGEKLVSGDAIILYIPNIVETYPDMVKEGWTLDDVKVFVEQYQLVLTVEEEETSQYKKGTVIRQSRGSDVPVVRGAPFKVTIAIEPKSGTNPGAPEGPLFPGGNGEEVTPDQDKEPSDKE